jgi:hypothetical protein
MQVHKLDYDGFEDCVQAASLGRQPVGARQGDKCSPQVCLFFFFFKKKH